MSNTSPNPFMKSVSGWFRRNFSDPEAISLFMMLLLGLIFIEVFGSMFMPILVSIVIAYLLAGLVQALMKIKVPYMLSVTLVYLFFLGLLVYLVLSLLPLLWNQLVELVKDLPSSFTKVQHWMNQFVTTHPTFVSRDQLTQVFNTLQSHVTDVGQYAVKNLLKLIPGVFSVVIYLILVPVLVFFFVKYTRAITQWFESYMPSNRTLLSEVWNEVNEKIGAYVRGRVLEVIIVGVVSSLAFGFLGMEYAILLGALVGLSVIIPYVGAVLVTIPVVIVGLMQWGWSGHFMFMIITYAVIIMADAYLLVPWLFSEAMNLHPLVIILSVVVFGAFWGFWGVFFAIPLVTLIDVVLTHWPRDQDQLEH